MSRAYVSVTLDDLPMFATDQQLAEALVGKAAAEKWLRERLPTIAAKPGFPKIDDFHGGRPVPLVKRFYANYLGDPGPERLGRANGAENEAGWKRPKRQA